MSVLSERIDDAVSLYVVSGLSLREIGNRYLATPEEVQAVLEAAGVSVTRPAAFRNSLEAADERLANRIAPPAPVLAPDESPDLRHCLAVIRALGGRCFSVLPLERSA